MIAGRYDGEVSALVDMLLKKRLRPEGGHFKVVLLSPPDSSETVRLAEPIINDQMSKTGKPTAFTMGQRYVSLQRLMTAKKTSDVA